ncbi:glycosyltransferase family 1 protein [Bacillus manliponensis]|uniref:glycosyltransferase family 1 protein n=1 Tax=Bacillus manliponensis TaxID=574376 RepID=UPI00351584BA
MGVPLRVLHAVVNMNRGGAETMIMNLYRNIDRSQVQFDFLTCKEGAFDEEIRQLGGKVYRIPYVTDVGHWGYMKALRSFFTENQQYKIVHSHMDKMSGLVLREAKRIGIPHRIAHSHNTSSEGNVLVKLYKWYAGNAILPSATHLFACSEAAAQWLFEREVTVLKNGIEYDKFAFSEKVREEMRQELELHKDTFVIGHVGRFAYQKNHLFLVEIFAQVIKVHSNSMLILVGDGPLRSKVEERVKELHIEENVKFLGVRSEVHHLLQAFDVFLFPSLHEGLPVTLIEAQGAGLPCIISNTITKEVDLGLGLVKRISLHNEKEWLEEINKVKVNGFSREVNEKALHDAGYDIKHTAEVTHDFYITMAR